MGLAVFACCEHRLAPYLKTELCGEVGKQAKVAVMDDVCDCLLGRSVRFPFSRCGEVAVRVWRVWPSGW